MSVTVLDAIPLHYQWLVAPEDRWAMTIVTLGGQYTFDCIIMGYRNSNFYVQRQMDVLLGDMGELDSYCDDIVLASKALEQHAVAFNLNRLRTRNIFVKFTNATVRAASSTR